MNCEKAKKIDVVDFLNRKGLKPKKILNNNYWYSSPFREEKTPSFKIDRTKNIWFDHGTGAGGNLIDLIIHLNKVNLSEAIKIIENETGFEIHNHKPGQNNQGTDKKNIQTALNKYEIKPLKNPILINYLLSRKINFELIETYCKEAHQETNGKNYFYVCFKNNSGGYELRNKYFKSCFSNKDITTIQGTNTDLKTIIIFEGFIDFLSCLTYKRMIKPDKDILVLNGIAQVNKAIEYLTNRDYKKIILFLDNDTEGKKTAEKIINVFPHAENLSMIIFPGEKDFNDFLIKSC